MSQGPSNALAGINGWSVAGWALAVACSAIGCARSMPDDGRIEVRGTVLYEAKPLERGSVLFAAKADRDVVSCRISPDGGFRVRLRPGEYLAAVRCLAPEPTSEDPSVIVQAKSLIPQKYSDASTSGLSVMASVGMDPVRLELRP